MVTINDVDPSSYSFDNVEIQPSFIPPHGEGLSLDQEVKPSFFSTQQFATPETADERAKRQHYALGEKSPGVDELSNEIQTGQEDYKRDERSLAYRADLNLRRSRLLTAAIQGLKPGDVTPAKVAEIQALDEKQVNDAYKDPQIFYERMFATKATELVASDYTDAEGTNQPISTSPIQKAAEGYNDILTNQGIARKLYEQSIEGMKDRTYGQAAKEWVPFYRWLKLSSAYNDPTADGGFLLANNIRSQIQAAYRLNPDDFLKSQTETVERLRQADPELAAQYTAALLGYTSSDAFSDTFANALDLTIFTPGIIYGVGKAGIAAGKAIGRAPFDYVSNIRLINAANRLNGLTAQLGKGGTIDWQALVPEARRVHQVALDNIRRKAERTGQGAEWSDMMNAVQSIHNPQSVLEGGTNMTAEQAARFEISLLATSRNTLDNLITRPSSLERLSLEEVALASSEAEKLVDTAYAKTTRGSRIVKIKAANLDASENLLDTDAVAIYYGTKEAGGYATQAAAKQQSKVLGIKQSLEEQIDGKWYIKTFQFVDEKTSTLQAFVKSNVKYEDKIQSTFLAPIFSRLRMRDSLIPVQLAEDFKYTQAATNAYFERNKSQFVSDFSGLSKQGKKDLDRFLERERDYRNQTSNTDVKRGRYAQTVHEFESRWQSELGRTPTFEETKAYFSWKTWNDVDYVTRNLDLTRSLTRLGIQNHELRFVIPGKEGFFYTPKLEGKVLTEFPWNRKGDAGILVWDVNPNTERSARKIYIENESPGPKEGATRIKETTFGQPGKVSKEMIDDLVKNKGYVVVHLSPHAKKRLADTMAGLPGGEGGGGEFVPPKNPIGPIKDTPIQPTSYTYQDVQKSLSTAIKASDSGSVDINSFTKTYFPEAKYEQVKPIFDDLMAKGRLYNENGRYSWKAPSKEEKVGDRFNKVDRAVDLARTSTNIKGDTFNVSNIFSRANMARYQMSDAGAVSWANKAIKDGDIIVTNPDTGEVLDKITRQHFTDENGPDFQIKFTKEPQFDAKEDFSKFNFSVEPPKPSLVKGLGDPIQTGNDNWTTFSIVKADNGEGFHVLKKAKQGQKTLSREFVGEDGSLQLKKRGEASPVPFKNYATKEEAQLAAKTEQDKFIKNLDLREETSTVETPAPVAREPSPVTFTEIPKEEAALSGMRTDVYSDYTGYSIKLNDIEVATALIKIEGDTLKVEQVTSKLTKADSKRSSKTTIEVTRKDGTTETRTMSSGGASKNANTLGPTVIKQFAEAVGEQFPDVKWIEGLRVSGARTKGKGVTTRASATSNMRIPVPEKKAVESTPPEIPTAPTQKGKGWKFPNYDYLLVSPEHDMRTTNLDFVRFPYQEGGHQVTTNPWHVRQAQIYEADNLAFGKDKATRHIYEGDKTAYSAATESDARDFSNRLEDVRALLADDLANGTNKAEAYYLQYMDGTSGDFKKFKNQFREFAKDGHLTTQHPFVVTPRDKSSWDYIQGLKAKDGKPYFANLENMRDSDHNLYYNDLNLKFALERSDNLEQVVRKGTTEHPIFGTGTEGTLSPMATLINSTSELIRGRIVDDLRFKSAENFGKSFASVIDATLEQVRRDPMEFIINPKWKQGLKGDDLKLLNAAKDYRRAVADFLSIKDPTNEYIMNLQHSIADGIKKSLRQQAYEWTDRHLMRSKVLTPIRWANGIVFDMFFGLFNLKQLVVQATTSYHTAAVLGPRIGLDAGWSAWAARGLLYNDRVDLAEMMGKMVSTASKGTRLGKEGIKKEWFVEALTSLKKSGWHIVGAETAMHDDFLNQSIKGSMVERGREYGRILFKEGDRFTRNTAYFGAYYEWRMANPTLKLTSRIEKELLNRADTLSLNMTGASNAAYAKGVASIPLKFTTYYARMMEQMLPGFGTLKTSEKVRAFAMYSVMFGVPTAASGVTGFWPWHKEWDKYLIDRGIDPDNENVLLNFFNNGAAEVLPGLLGPNHNLSATLGPSGSDWLYDIYNGRSQVFDVITGAAGTKMADIYENSWPFYTFVANAFRSDENAWPLTYADFEALLRTPSSVNNLWKAIEIYNTGGYLTKNQTPLMASGADGMDSLMTLMFGSMPNDIQRAFTLSDMTRATAKMKEKAQKDITRINRLEMKAIAEGDVEGAMTYGKQIKMLIIKNGFMPQELSKVFTDSITASGDLRKLAERKFNESTPDRQKMLLDKQRSKQPLKETP